MEEEAKLPLMARESSRPLRVVGILKEALCLPTRNGKLMLSIILLVLVPFCILALASNLVLTPVARDLIFKIAHFPKGDPNSPKVKEISDEIKEDIRLLLSFEAIFFVMMCIMALFSLVVTVHSTAMIYTGKSFTLNDLFSMMRIGGSWKRPMITSFYVSLISAAYGLLIMGLSIFIVMATDGVILTVLCSLLGLSGSLFYVYLTAVWMLGLVISIVEEDCYGMKALGKAGELIRGRKLQGFALMLLLYITTMAILVVYFCAMRVMKQMTAARLVTWAIVFCLIWVVKLFMYVVNTVFYYECKKTNGGENVYVPVPTGEV
ncbi:uncharacterized protein LOC131256439 [Magnolia sinica]|uniref:uncharacterized protein LOC131256439 n=1 Tax=Magnolia sinica TaxID=86752 RepID=UPI00265B0EE6|nr:uncharacterized protein LOC131256439 [Magnolia sinica]